MELYLGYGFTILNYILYCSSRFMKKKYQMLTMDLLAKLSMFAALYFLSALSGAYSMLISFLVLITANIKVRKNKKWIPLYIIFEAAYIGVAIWKFDGISSIIMLICSTISLLSIWWLKPQMMRIAGLSTNFLSLCYQLSIQNYAGLLELIVMGSNIFSYIKYKKKQKKTIEKTQSE